LSKKYLQTVITFHSLKGLTYHAEFEKNMSKTILGQKIYRVTSFHPIIFCHKTFWSYFFQTLRVKTFPKCPNTCNLIQWVESYDHLKIFRRLFLVQNTIFSKICKNCKKIFFTKTEYTVCLNRVQSMIYIFLGEIEDPKMYDRPSFSESALYSYFVLIFRLF
jgi:hypothetical protein